MFLQFFLVLLTLFKGFGRILHLKTTNVCVQTSKNHHIYMFSRQNLSPCKSLKAQNL